MDNALLIATMSATGYVVFNFLAYALQPFFLMAGLL